MTEFKPLPPQHERIMTREQLNAYEAEIKLEIRRAWLVMIKSIVKGILAIGVILAILFFAVYGFASWL